MRKQLRVNKIWVSELVHGAVLALTLTFYATVNVCWVFLDTYVPEESSSYAFVPTPKRMLLHTIRPSMVARGIRSVRKRHRLHDRELCKGESAHVC